MHDILVPQLWLLAVRTCHSLVLTVRVVYGHRTTRVHDQQLRFIKYWNLGGCSTLFQCMSSWCVYYNIGILVSLFHVGGTLHPPYFSSTHTLDRVCLIVVNALKFCIISRMYRILSTRPVTYWRIKKGRTKSDIATKKIDKLQMRVFGIIGFYSQFTTQKPWLEISKSPLRSRIHTNVCGGCVHNATPRIQKCMHTHAN